MRFENVKSIFLDMLDYRMDITLAIFARSMCYLKISELIDLLRIQRKMDRKF